MDLHFSTGQINVDGFGYFHQDIATAYKSQETMRLLHEFYDNRLIDFPARSPDLTNLFFRTSKIVYKNRFHTGEKVTEAEDYFAHLL